VSRRDATQRMRFGVKRNLLEIQCCRKSLQQVTYLPYFFT